ncbi:DNA mismatch repair endonuclease MutL [Asaia krungthepensis]|uniref:DNA mismatch repair protein MutL n=1 Tax=Asaia krungthepensis NRIC 0535 TaxID=1307925 RepID=A0ABQ0Q2I3_9PROT|nr:DNA mismatch repair endonuclease MutL [Asaia krungthepensis]GBQ88173.1 DNA mismatch repair protein MutL [Asaia krungthepensis NRIC 0535]
MPPSERPLLQPRLRRLSNHVIDLIAAGEVVERPAAALKEIVENALDAGATRIEVALLNGGCDRIEVSDNGCGMSPDDLVMAVERHCTSKLSDETLTHIVTLGFRGEALPSIGATARLTLTSRQHDADTAWTLRLEGGALTPPSPAAGAPGTRVVVEDLFFATPARRKFLKSARVEGSHAEGVMRRLALSAPHCAMRFTLDERPVFDFPVQSVIERVQAVLGESESLIALDETRNGLHLSGFICGPAATRSTAASQFLVVNNRPVADPLMRTAIRVAYRPVIEPGRHPVLALHLRLPHDRVDVNVHPSKTELRFAEEADVRGLMIGAMQRALGHGAGEAGVRMRFAAPARQAIHYPPPDPVSLTSGFIAAHSAMAGLGAPAALSPKSDIQGFAEGLGSFEPATRPSMEPDPIQRTSFPLGAPVAQVFDTYILAVGQDGDLILVDQHAAHERLTHEKLLAQYTSGSLKAQRLLLPEVIDLPPGQAGRLLEWKTALEALGLEIESFGGGSVLLRTMPVLLQGGDGVSLLRDLSEELTADPDLVPGDSAALERRIDAVIARMACHGSIRAGRRLQQDEMSALLRQMEQTPRANTCSHGRPTWLRLGRDELEKLFGRIR